MISEFIPEINKSEFLPDKILESYTKNKQNKTKQKQTNKKTQQFLWYICASSSLS